YIGTDVTGTRDLGNGGHGIFFVKGAHCRIGGEEAWQRNIIAGNGGNGIYFSRNGFSTGRDNLILNNFIGVDVTGTNALGNDGHGIRDADARTVIGSVGAGNLISGNGLDGLRFDRQSAADVLVQANYIGTDLTGTRDLGNLGDGIRQDRADRITIGGPGIHEGNLISGNGGVGVSLSPFVGSDVVQGNRIGTDITGLAALPNGNGGLLLSLSSLNRIGGRKPGEGNLIAGNTGAGVTITGGANDRRNILYGNWIGVDRTGLTALPNTGPGLVIIGSAENVIGDNFEGAGNIISGNGDHAMSMSGTTANGNRIKGNYIGVGRDGVRSISNHGNGIEMNLVGQTEVGDDSGRGGNIIAANLGHGISMSGNAASTNNVVAGNAIGVDADGNPMGNAGNGIVLTSLKRVLVGSVSRGGPNVIAYNGESGIEVNSSGTGHSFLGNTIFSNVDLGIDLHLDGVSTNDIGDPDTGANNRQNFPVISHVTLGPTAVGGTLNSASATTYRLEFFFNRVCDASGFGEGERFLGAETVVTDASGHAGFNGLFGLNVPVGYFITATATDTDTGDTSEFSACFDVLGSDLDGDGMPNDFETVHGLNPNDPADAMDDPDGDGVSNLEEYIADTDPRNGDSVLVIGSISSGPPSVVSWMSSSNRVYDVQYTTNILAPGWLNLKSNIPGSGGIIQDVDSSGVQRRYYRIRVRVP
ncbi:MAG: hypothetical protein AAF492_06400, partial [Verrucomicrobiota bacterium]